MALRSPTDRFRIRRIKESDYKEIDSWYRLRNMDRPDHDEYPNIGFIINGTCAGFLYQTDSNIAFIDGFIANPSTDVFEREDALDTLTQTLMNFAHQRGFKKILAYTRHPAVKKRCRKYGFEYRADHSLYSREV